ncbi:SemiSWEET transporter [Aliarcobacter butzleri]|uniref:SemiSWEET transporter n=1 Tax=Aliarcobacter butzleri TaxID=28197 RepID=UPI001EDBC850|nr:SemiSWEET transporter [Aliarcobacter butzleri]
MENLIGYFAAFCTTIAFIPQAIKIIKTKNTKSLSLAMYIIFSLGVFSWFIYGIIKMDFPIIIVSFLTFIFAFTILVYKLREKNV